MTPVPEQWKRTSRWFLSSTLLAVSIGIIGICVLQGTIRFGERLGPATSGANNILSTGELSLRQLQGFLGEEPLHGGFGGEESAEPEDTDTKPESGFILDAEDFETNETKPEVNLLTDVDLGLWENGFQIKLYWQEGYRWQESLAESKCKWNISYKYYLFSSLLLVPGSNNSDRDSTYHESITGCMTRDYEGSPITGKCWYGDLSRPCNETEIFVDRCSPPEDPDPKQLFEFIPVSDDEVLIAAYGENRCFERLRQNVTLQPCNGKLGRQRWWAIRGGFNERRFEISQKLVPTNCLNQDHHPKPGEHVRMFLCDVVRLPSQETSWWNIYQ